MKHFGWPIILGIALVALSAIGYGVHYAVFRDAHHIFIFLVGDIAFVFVEVLLVTTVIHRVLEEREKKSRLNKLNMVIGTFFSEVGTDLLKRFANFDPDLNGIRHELGVTDSWSDEQFDEAAKHLRRYGYTSRIEELKLDELRSFLSSKRDFLLRLLENPTLLEHESFTEMLRAVFHLSEELTARGDLGEIPEADSKHLAADIHRVYLRLVHEWLDYMQYLKANYPYLFSFAIRTNPFDRAASPYVH